MSDESPRRSAAPAAPQKRELEQAPQLVRKAATVLMVGAQFPWLSSISTGGELPWGNWFGALVLTLLAGGILMESAKHRAGLKANGLVKSIAGAHPMAGSIAGLAVFVAAIVVCFMGESVWAGGNPYGELARYIEPGTDPAAIPDNASNTFPFRAVMEMGTLFLAIATLAHVLAYEYGGKFNPIFPLMFLGPAIAGALQALGTFSLMGEHPLVPLGLLGSLIVAAGGFMAMYTMFVSMKEAKVQGEIKAAAMREERKRQRAARREQNKG